jgi:predicted short-subunit dehydrogenase-like oxidoreductase (DUF2520 family)
VTPATGGRGTATPSVFVLGAGRAGKGLARALLASGSVVTGLHGRRAEGAREGLPAVTAGALPESLAAASVALVAVQDAALEDALNELLASRWLAPTAVVLHASGSAEAAGGAAALRRAGHAFGTFHPLVPLSDAARAPAMLRDAWIGVDGDAAARDAAVRLAGALGARTLVIPPGAKPRYHAAAVFASNFPVVLAAIAARLMSDAGVDAEPARGAVERLLALAAANVAGHDPAAALTGPVVRGDAVTVRRHLDALAGDQEALDAYLALSRAALGMTVLDAPTARALRQALDAPPAERK